MWENLGISPVEALMVAVSAIGMYFTFLILIRLLGQRVLASMSSFDLAAVIALGSVAGRSILGYTPTLTAGIIGVATLLAMQAITGRIRQSRRGSAIVSNRPLLLMAGREVLIGNLHHAHMVEDELHAKLRQAGVRATSEVACVILESTGAVSVLHRGELIEPDLLRNVQDAGAIPPELIGPSQRA
ncbi:DUF421 domain-containing protein [Arthrobacter sp. H14]|uniref:DUF421 domain-containing protein n=1 Tax=Arthrobacter sp. H14 TaxID=1312959 RepID=UPI00047BBEB3|nr:YetF domain-containing protein [Arthrobacter sp. H14]